MNLLILSFFCKPNPPPLTPVASQFKTLLNRSPLIYMEKIFNLKLNFLNSVFNESVIKNVVM